MATVSLDDGGKVSLEGTDIAHRKRKRTSDNLEPLKGYYRCWRVWLAFMAPAKKSIRACTPLQIFH